MEEGQEEVSELVCQLLKLDIDNINWIRNSVNMF